MKRKLIILATGASLTVFLSVGVALVMILYPQNLFAKRVDYKNLRVYSNQDFEDNYERVFENALMLAESSELYNDQLSFDIFIASGSWYNWLDTKVFGRALARSTDNNIILKVDADFGNDLLTGPRNKRNLTKTLAHEIVHCLQFERYGVLKFNPLFPPETWKLEGYPEYIANKKGMDGVPVNLSDSIRKLRAAEKSGTQWIEIAPGQSDPLIYFKGQVLTEYLIDIKGMTYDQILDDEVNEKEAYDEMMRWYGME